MTPSNGGTDTMPILIPLCEMSLTVDCSILQLSAYRSITNQSRPYYSSPATLPTKRINLNNMAKSFNGRDKALSITSFSTYLNLRHPSWFEYATVRLSWMTA